MPRNVRNFWVEVEINGYKHILKGGPKASNGDMRITLFQRDRGEILEVMQVNSIMAGDEKTLISRVDIPQNGGLGLVTEIRTER